MITRYLERGTRTRELFASAVPSATFLYILAGAHDRTRTGDPVLTKNVLYLLSYVGLIPLSTPNYQLSTIMVAGVGFEPT